MSVYQASCSAFVSAALEDFLCKESIFRVLAGHSLKFALAVVA